MRIAFQGERGAYSEAAAIEYFGDAIEPVPCETFEDVFALVTNQECDDGLVPIENSLAGSIHQNYDLLERNALRITGEHILRVEHCLIVHPQVSLDDVRTVVSHPQALAQCDHFIRAHRWAREAAYDTAGSVKLIKEQDRRDAAAIASRHAAFVYGMSIVAENIEDDPQNFTRFIVLAREDEGGQMPAPPMKTSIVFALRNVPGALFKALSVFALRDIDLTKIESRPIPGKPWEYLFYLDFAGSATEERGLRALQHLAEIATYLRVFGSYPRAENKAGSPAAPGDARRWKENVRWEWNQNSRG
jgi:prephenate dehydratase